MKPKHEWFSVFCPTGLGASPEDAEGSEGRNSLGLNPRENHLGESRDAHRPWPFRLKDSGVEVRGNFSFPVPALPEFLGPNMPSDGLTPFPPG